MPRLLNDLLAPTPPGNKSFADIAAAFRNHFEPKRSVLAERFHFHKREQGVGKTIAEFDAALRKLAVHCQFGEKLETSLRDRFVCGLRHDAYIQHRLLSETTLTYHKEFKISGRSRGEWNRPTMKRRLSSRQTRQSRNWGPAPRSQKPFRAVVAVVVPTTGQPTASSRRPSAIPVGKQNTLHLSAGQSPCSPGKNVRSPTKLRRPITFRMISNHLTMQPVATVSSCCTRWGGVHQTPSPCLCC